MTWDLEIRHCEGRELCYNRGCNPKVFGISVCKTSPSTPGNHKIFFPDYQSSKKLNYQYWRLQVLSTVRAHGFENFLFGTESAPIMYSEMTNLLWVMALPCLFHILVLHLSHHMLQINHCCSKISSMFPLTLRIWSVSEGVLSQGLYQLDLTSLLKTHPALRFIGSPILRNFKKFWGVLECIASRSFNS
ncbi:hypothetical protein DH2020_032273 [Rehmannia glutinosa]|uniref:Uncharacterized protein n=1 Tax=Rehmannia glutinosa TaxID=99300 RepID=A0ABR0VFN5_REHGL